MPGAHAFIMLGLGFETMGVPALKIDGRRVQGTRAISRALDELVPERPLFPADPARRRAVEDAERWGEELQNADAADVLLRRAPRSGERSRASWRRGARCRCGSRCASRRPLIIRLATGAHRASDAAGREDLELLPERLDQIDAWIAEGVLGGERAQRGRLPDRASTSRRCSCADGPRAVHRGRPAAALARRVAPDYAGHVRPASCRPNGWRRCATTRPRKAGRRAGRRAPRPVTSAWPRREADARRARGAHAPRAARRRPAALLRDGYHGTTLDDIADEAGYTKGAVYSTFKSKAGLFLALFDEVVDRRVAEVRAMLSRPHEDARRLAALAAQPVDERNAQFLLLAIEFWSTPRASPALLDAFSERYRRLRAQLAELAPARSPLGEERWALVTLALSNGLALERLIDPDGVPDDLMAAVQQRLLR